jgi:hypothetical protein
MPCADDLESDAHLPWHIAQLLNNKKSFERLENHEVLRE